MRFISTIAALVAGSATVRTVLATTETSNNKDLANSECSAALSARFAPRIHSIQTPCDGPDGLTVFGSTLPITTYSMPTPLAPINSEQYSEAATSETSAWYSSIATLVAVAASTYYIGQGYRQFSLACAEPAADTASVFDCNVVERKTSTGQLYIDAIPTASSVVAHDTAAAANREPVQLNADTPDPDDDFEKVDPPSRPSSALKLR